MTQRNAAVLLLLITAVTAQYQPPSGMNRYCGAHIYDSGAYPTCQYLLKSNYASVTGGTPEYNSVVFTIMKIPCLPPFQDGDQDNIPVSTANYTDTNGQPPAACFAQPLQFPETVTFPLGFWITGVSYVETADNLVVDEWNDAGTVFGPQAIAATPAACRGLLLYAFDQVDAARSSITFDMNVDSDANGGTFTSNDANQVIITPLVLPITQTSTNNVTAAIVPAAYELLNKDSYQLPLEVSRTYGTNRWVNLYGTAWRSSRNAGIPGRGLGGVSQSAATITWVNPGGACNAIGANRFSIKFTGTFNQTEAAVPVRIQYSAADHAAQRVAYAPSGTTNIVNRPPLAVAKTARIRMQPYCRNLVQGSAVPFIQALIAQGVNFQYWPPSNVLQNAIVYILYATNMVSDDVGAYARIFFVKPTDPSQDDLRAPLYLYNGYRMFVTTTSVDQEPNLVYLQSYSPNNEFELVANEADISSIPYCSCQYNTTQLMWTGGGLLECNTQNEVTLNSIVPNPTWDNAPVSTGVLPSCTIFLENGYNGSPNLVLQNGNYTAGAFFVSADTFVWSTLNSAPGSLRFDNSSTGGSGIRFLINTRLSTVSLSLQVSNTTMSPVASANCTLQLRTLALDPTAVVVPDNVVMSLSAGPLLLNASGSISPAGEVLTYQWAIVTTPFTVLSVVPGTLQSTGNVAVNYFTPNVPGTFQLRLMAMNPRGAISFAPIYVRVVNNTAAPNITEPVNICINPINNTESTDTNIGPFSEGQLYIPAPPQQLPFFNGPGQEAPPLAVPVEAPINSSVPSDAPFSGSNSVGSLWAAFIALVFVIFGVLILLLCIVTWRMIVRIAKHGVWRRQTEDVRLPLPK